MRKIGLGFIGIIVIAMIYYFTSGSTRVTEEIKKQVNHELLTLQQNGFGVGEREVKKSEEHFVLDFSEPKKIISYLKHQGLQVNIKDLSSLKGMKFAVDAKYLNDTYSALSVDIYPKALPSKIVTSLKAEDQKMLSRIEKMIADKTLLIHIDFNKLLSGFKGYIKNIDETFKDEVTMHLLAQGMTFDGSLKNEKLKNLQQTVKHFSLVADDKIDVTLSNFTTEYALKSESAYDTHANYRVENFKMRAEKIFRMELSNIKGSSTTSLKNKLLKSTIHSTIEGILVQEKQKKYTLKQSLFDLTIDNLDIEAFEKLQTVNSEDHTAINLLTQQILSKGVEFNISKLSSKEVTIDDASMGNFDLSASGNIDKGLDIAAAQQNPFILLQALSAQTHVEASPALFLHLMQDPRAMMVMMLIPPEEKNGQKVYDVSYIKGKLTVNGMNF